MLGPYMQSHIVFPFAPVPADGTLKLRFHSALELDMPFQYVLVLVFLHASRALELLLYVVPLPFLENFSDYVFGVYRVVLLYLIYNGEKLAFVSKVFKFIG